MHLCVPNKVVTNPTSDDRHACASPRLQALRRGSRGLQRLAYSGSLQLAMGSAGGSVLAGLSSLTRLTLCNTAGPHTAGVIAQTFILGMQSGYIVRACPI